MERVWERAVVETKFGRRTLGRAYAKLDAPALRAGFLRLLHGAGAEVLAGTAVALDHSATETRVKLEGGQVLRARAVVDASGARSPFVERIHGRIPGLQVAYGVLLDAPGHPFDRNEAVLMDFRPAPSARSEPPTFLYALPLDGGRLFVEETSLADRAGVDMDHLRRRLRSRLAALGLDTCAQLSEERCVIPMGAGLPVARQRILPFGAAASMVHPASGYLVSHVARKVEPVAAALVRGLDAASPRVAIDSAMDALWSREQRVAWELYAFGLESLLGMSAHETAGFFDAFFDLPSTAWSGYLAGTVSPPKLGAIMTRLFRNLPLSLRWRLLRTSVPGGVAPLARSILRTGIA
jgi:lycopene beta-cyclase